MWGEEPETQDHPSFRIRSLEQVSKPLPQEAMAYTYVY